MGEEIGERREKRERGEMGERRDPDTDLREGGGDKGGGGGIGRPKEGE